MKNKKIKLLLVVCILLLTSGCGSSDYLQDEDGNIVKYEETGQSLQKNILCLPDEDGDLYTIYSEYEDQLDFPIDELPYCTDFKMNSTESSGIWEFIFVKPLAYLILKLGDVVNNLGISLILIGLAIRIILLPFTIKSSSMSFKMKKAQPEIDKIERKYRNKTDNESLMAKSQETMLVYQKYKINPMSGCLMSLIQIPIFFAFLQAIYRVPSIYEETLFGFNLGMTPMVGLKNGNYAYIILLVLIAISTYFSFNQSMSQAANQTDEMKSQMKIMLYVMLVVIVYGSLSLPTALTFYWIVTYAFIAIQNILIKMINNRSITNKPRKNKNDKIKDKLAKKEGMKYGKNN